MNKLNNKNEKNSYVVLLRKKNPDDLYKNYCSFHFTVYK